MSRTTPSLKLCTKCRNRKNRTEFSKDKRASDGRLSRCKTCRKRAAAIYRATHPLTDEQKARMNRQSKDWYLKNKDHYLHNKKLYKRKMRARIRAQGEGVGAMLKSIEKFDPSAWRKRARESHLRILARQS